MARRVLLAAALAVSLLAVALVGVVAFRDDDAREVVSRVTTTTTTTTTGPAPVPRPPGGVTTTTKKGDPIQTEGAAPVDGSILSIAADDPGDPVDVGEETDCADLDPSSDPIACIRVDGSGGEFLVYAGRTESAGLRAALFRAEGGNTFILVRRSQIFTRGGDVIDLSLAEADVGGEPVVIVDYDFGGSGAVHSFDVVAWDSTDVDPRVVAFINGTGGDRHVPEGAALAFVSANYDDGAPTCCPNRADVRTLRRDAPGKWAVTKKTVAFADAP